MRQALREAALLVLLSCLIGFSYTAATKRGLFAEKTNAPITTPQLVELTDAKRLFDGGEALFLDSRHEFDYKLGHIKGAINIPVDKFEQEQSKLSGIEKDNLIVVYCDGAECNSSFEMAGKLYAAGYRNIRVFFGGWQNWQEKNFPIEN